MSIESNNSGPVTVPRLRRRPGARLEGRTKKPRPPTAASHKAPTGVAGFDGVTGGGLPRGRTTLLLGGPGSGKTIFAMQFLAHGARMSGEPGIFVAFEETPDRIIANCSSFGWDLEDLRRRKLFFLDAQPLPDLIQAGTFDISGMLAALGVQARRMKARRIVFDALDIVLALLPDPATKRTEIYRLHTWLVEQGLTGLITAKADDDEQIPFSKPTNGLLQYMVDCSIVLNHRLEQGISQRNLRVQKYRGSQFNEDEAPFVIGKGGFDVGIARTLGRQDAAVTSERVSSGVERLDSMLGGGYFRGATVLITGYPGTAKTTLSGAFAEAACQRGERTMFVSFDSDGSEVVRNLTSVGIRLGPYIKDGRLSMVSARALTGSAESLMVHIKALTKEHGARCVVIDPISTLSRAGNELTAHSVAERLMDWSKASGTTLVCTSLHDELSGHTEGVTALHISTLADTWLHLSYLVQAGERNRGLSIIKSRGTAHSNQVRELVLSSEGVTLADTYAAGGEVLMGAMRWEKETAMQLASEDAEVANELKRVSLEAEEAVLQVRAKSLQTELAAKTVEKSLLARATANRGHSMKRGADRMRELRGADAAIQLPAGRLR